MDMKSYQNFAKTTDMTLYGSHETKLLHYLAGLTSEVGEVNALFQKGARKDGIRNMEVNKDQLLSEIGDVLWYLTRLANHHGLDMRNIMSYNVDKLMARHRNSL